MRIYTHTFRCLHLKIRDQKRQAFQWRNHKTHTHQGFLMFLEFMAWSLFFSQPRYAEEGEKRQAPYCCGKLFTKQKLLQGLWQSSRAWSAAQGNIIGFTVLDFVTRACYPDLEEMTSLVRDWTQLQVKKNPPNLTFKKMNLHLPYNPNCFYSADLWI